MLKVGLTGGIGSGKSTVALVFKSLGIPVYNSDIRAKTLMDEDAILRDQICSEFNISLIDSRVDKKALASIVFSDKEALSKLTKLVHPRVALDYSSWVDRQDSLYTIKEAAILFESGAYKEMDHVITVSAPEDMRIDRVIDRDASNKSLVRERMNNQMTEAERLRLADFVILNDGSKSIISQVLSIHSALISLD